MGEWDGGDEHAAMLCHRWRLTMHDFVCIGSHAVGLGPICRDARLRGNGACRGGWAICEASSQHASMHLLKLGGKGRGGVGSSPMEAQAHPMHGGPTIVGPRAIRGGYVQVPTLAYGAGPALHGMLVGMGGTQACSEVCNGLGNTAWGWLASYMHHGMRWAWGLV